MLNDNIIIVRRTYKKRPTKYGKRRIFFYKGRERKKARRQVIEEIAVQVGALRGQRGANGAR